MDCKYPNCVCVPEYDCLAKFSKCPNSCGSNEGCSDCPKSTKQSYSRLKVQGKWKSYVRKLLNNPRANSTSYNPQDVAKLYGWPTGITGIVFPIYLIELGGGFDPNIIANTFAAFSPRLPAPKLSVISVDGATNSYTGNPQSADVEVVLDIICAAAAYSYMTGLAADIRVVFAQNTDTSFVNAVNTVAMAGNGVCSISWGSPEDQNTASNIAAMDKAFLAGLNNGITWTVAAGDNGSSDGESGNHADYPGSSPYVISCGGTYLQSSGNTITNETVWNDGSQGGASGGGVSAVEAKPSYQNAVNSTNFRVEPDLVGNADPNSGYDVANFGSVGGTSAVAPLTAGYLAAACTANGKALGNILPTIYANGSLCRDITEGSDGSYSASVGFDIASGWGVPTALLFGSLVGGTTVTPPPTSNPPPVNPVPPTPTSPTLLDCENEVNLICQDIEQQVNLRYARLVELVRQKVNAGLNQLFATKAKWFK